MNVQPAAGKLEYKQKRRNRNSLVYALLLAGPLTLFLIFFIVPNVTSFLYSLFNYDGFGNFEFIGLQNFRNLLRDRNFGIAFKNTIIYTVTTMIVQNALALVLAVLLQKSTTTNNFFKTINYLPAIMSSVAIGFVWGFIFDPNIGIINTLLSNIGLDSWAQNWLGDKNLVMLSISAIHVWQAVGGATIIFIAGLLEIPKDLYECANVEGANALQSFFKITLPLLMPVTIINLVLTMIGCFKSFDYVYVMTGGGGDGASHVIATLLFKTGFQYTRVGYSSAMAVVLSVTAAGFALMQLKLNKDEVSVKKPKKEVKNRDEKQKLLYRS